MENNLEHTISTLTGKSVSKGDDKYQINGIETSEDDDMTTLLVDITINDRRRYLIKIPVSNKAIENEDFDLCGFVDKMIDSTMTMILKRQKK